MFLVADKDSVLLIQAAPGKTGTLLSLFLIIYFLDFFSPEMPTHVCWYDHFQAYFSGCPSHLFTLLQHMVVRAGYRTLYFSSCRRPMPKHAHCLLSPHWTPVPISQHEPC